jgi:RNA polymerase sigma factor (sigma-70 family)
MVSSHSSDGAGECRLDGVEFETLRLVQGCKAGDADAERQHFVKYITRLQLLLAARIPAGACRRFDPGDVAQSVLISLFRAAREDRLVLERSGDLWAWLVRIAFNKLSSRLRMHMALSRSTAVEEVESEGGGLDRTLGFLIDEAPTVEEVAAIADELDHLFGPPGSPLRDLVDLRLQDMTFEEIGRRLGVSHTTVGRRLQKIGEILEARWRALEWAAE